MRQRVLAEKRAKEARGKDTTHGIWEVLYRVRVPMQASRSINDMRMRGTVLSGNKDVDADINFRTNVTWLTIDSMVELFKQGVVVGVCNPADTKKIYIAVNDHIQMWKLQLEKGVNVGDAPVDDLITLDTFAKAVYEEAKWMFAGEIIDDSNIRYIQNIIQINPQNFFNAKAINKLVHGNNAENVTVKDNGDVIINGGTVVPERDSFQEFFKEQMVNLSVRRSI